MSIVVATITLVTGCGGSGSGSGGSSGSSGSKSSAGAGTTGSSGKGPNCSLIPKADVMSKLGVTGLDDAQMMVNDIVTVCNFPEGANPVAVTIRYQTPTDASEFMLGKQGFADNMLTTMDTSDIGDMAYTSTVGSGSFVINTLVFLHGNVEVEIVAAAGFDKIKALGNEIISKL